MILFLAVTACGPKEPGRAPAGSAAAAPAYGDIMVEGSIGDASNLIPLLASDSTSHEIAGLVFNGLIKYDKDISIVGDLAESWEISGDGLVITFHLRKGVRWHDGRPFTAADVLYTYQVTVDPKTPTAYAGDFLKVKKAEVLDDWTFRATYDKPFAPALMSWSVGILPKHLLADKEITTSPLGRHPIGTGPYKFKEWVTGQKIVLVSNPDYFEGRPYIDGFILRIIPDTATMFLELRANGIDRMGLTPLQYMRQTENNLFRENFNKYRYLSFAYTYMGYNLKNPLFTDKRVRQAIAHAVNRVEMIDGVLIGLGKPATGPYKPGTWAYNPNVRAYPYDPAKAKALLAEAGWKDVNGDGVIEKEGRPFAFEQFVIRMNHLHAVIVDLGAAAQEDLEAGPQLAQQVGLAEPLAEQRAAVVGDGDRLDGPPLARPPLPGGEHASQDRGFGAGPQVPDRGDPAAVQVRPRVVPQQIGDRDDPETGEGLRPHRTHALQELDRAVPGDRRRHGGPFGWGKIL
ncbi:MAG: peptide-binding protein, partial [Proteobacteria bacterium]|nr:peptide-binding protein [Pseudomonadota bacterium]